MIKPTQPVPALEVATVGGGTWRLAERKPELFTIVEVYRGYHCPRCKVHLLDLDHKVARFEERGCEVIAVSMDTQERAEKAKQEWGIASLTIGYGLAEDQAREWGLYISKPIQSKEPGNFAEPGMFLVRPDGTLYSAVVHTTPFHRHHFADVMEAIDMIRARNYPPRGDV
ncbi:MAG: peroxiredoxin-like family protein [Rhodospirillales bacterium]